MIYKKKLAILVISLFFISSALFAQLELSVYTDKDTYQYGEKIELFCKVTNIADTTFKFFAGSYHSCQAEFSFNDFNSWEHTDCLATSELLIFKPHTLKIYSWKIEPSESGLPNNDGTQMIIGKYYFGLLDTIYINAPQFLGGQLHVGFLPTNSDSVQSIKDSLNVTVLEHSEYGTSISELWQIEGYQIDSVINHFQKDSILTYIENAVFLMYDKIENENPLAFYPLHVGDIWQYFVEEKQIGEENETARYIEISVVGKDTIDNKSYFRLTNSENYCLQYLRIDSSNATIWELKDGSECMIDSLTMLPNSKGFSNQCFGSSEFISDTTKVIFNQERDVKKFYYTDGTTCTFCTRGYYEYAENIGKTFKHIIYPAPEGFEGGYKIESLVYAKINGKDYGVKVSVPLQDNLPLKFSLSQNYPNPFNPSTTIKYSIPSIAVIASGAKQSSKIATSSDETWTPRNDNLNITLKIYDILGREVATLVNKEQKPGNYEVQLNASNLTSGIYFYRLQSGSFVESRKMILIK